VSAAVWTPKLWTPPKRWRRHLDENDIFRAMLTSTEKKRWASGQVPTIFRPGSADVPSNPISGYTAAVLADAPVLYWKFDETSGTNVQDFASSGPFTGTCQGTVTRNVPAIVPGAGVTPGTTTADYISTPDAATLDITGAYSAEFWIKTTSLAASQMMVSKGRDGASSAGYGVFLGTTGALVLCKVQVTNGSPGSNAVITTGNWYHCVVTYPGGTGTISFYINGAAQGTNTSQTLAANATTKAFEVARCDDNGTLRFPVNGSMDEVAIYNTVLNSTQVSNHYNARLT